MVGPRDRAGHVLGADRERAGHRVDAGHPLKLTAGEERLVGQVAARLLADHHDQRHPGGPGVGQSVDRVSEAGRGVQVHEGRPGRGDRVPGGHPDQGSLVQREHEFEILRQVCQEGDLSRTGVAEDLGHAEPAHDLERGVPDVHWRGYSQAPRRRVPLLRQEERP